MIPNIIQVFQTLPQPYHFLKKHLNWAIIGPQFFENKTSEIHIVGTPILLPGAHNT